MLSQLYKYRKLIMLSKLNIFFSDFGSGGRRFESDLDFNQCWYKFSQKRGNMIDLTVCLKGEVSCN